MKWSHEMMGVLTGDGSPKVNGVAVPPGGCSAEAKAGFDYRDPWQANNDRAFADEKAAAHEIATATADVACRDEHNVNGIWVAVRSAYQNRLIDANAEALGQHEAAVAGQLETAAEVLTAIR